MILLNFSHPLTMQQREELERLTGQTIERVIERMPQFDDHAPFHPQLEEFLTQVDLTATEWQSEPILVMPPSLNAITAILLAELHGRMGYFPPIVRLRPAANTPPRRYEVAEILDLQAIREAARKHRSGRSPS